MRVSKIILKDFRRFSDLTIDLGDDPKKVVALVGPNGSGKSSVFDAFEEKLKNYKGINNEFPQSYYSKKWFLETPVEEYTRGDSVKIFNKEKNETFTKESFYVRSPYRYSSRFVIQNLQKQPDITEDPDRPANTSSLDNRLLQNYQHLRWQMLKEFEEGEKSGKQVREEILGKINQALSAILDIKISSLGSIVEGKGQLFFTKGVAKNFPFENLSSGEKAVVDMLIDIIVKIPKYENTIYCIDEPELHVNTRIQRKLLVELEKLIPDTCQLWVATHSIGFVRALQIDLADKADIIDFSNFDFDKPAILSPVKKGWKVYKNLFETALDDLADLITPKRLVYCEGKIQPAASGDDQGLDATVYNLIFSNTIPDLLFVSSGGSTQVNNGAGLALTVLSKVIKSLDVKILKDKDIKSDGSATTDSDRTDWLSKEPTVRRMLKRKEIENYLFDFEIMNKYDNHISKEEYAKIISDIKDQDVKSKVGDLMKLCGIHTGLSKEEFKIKLAEKVTSETNVYKELMECIS